MKINMDLTKVLKKVHEKKWVALSEDQKSVIDFAEKLSQLQERLGDRKDVVYMKVLASDTEYAF